MKRLTFCVSLFICTVVGAGVLGCGTSNGVSEARRLNNSVVLTNSDGRSSVPGVSIFDGETEEVQERFRSELYPLGADWAWAQRLHVVTAKVWAVPARGRLCLIEVAGGRAGSVACTRLARAVRAGMYIASVPAGVPGTSDLRTVVGLVPDGVERVRIHAHGARPLTVPVVENVFALRDHGRAFPESIELIRAP